MTTIEWAAAGAAYLIAYAGFLIACVHGAYPRGNS